jgi:hypothetical protein
MPTRTLPTVGTLESNDDSQLMVELRLARARAQLAVVRTLADRIEVIANPRLVGLDDQLIEEIARLGCRLLEAAAELTRSPAPEDTGVFHRPPAMRAT